MSVVGNKLRSTDAVECVEASCSCMHSTSPRVARNTGSVYPVACSSSIAITVETGPVQSGTWPLQRRRLAHRPSVPLHLGVQKPCGKFLRDERSRRINNLHSLDPDVSPVSSAFPLPRRTTCIFHHYFAILTNIQDTPRFRTLAKEI